MSNSTDIFIQVLQQLEEEALMEECLEAMLEEERQHQRNIDSSVATACMTENNAAELCQQLNSLSIMHDDSLAKQVVLVFIFIFFEMKNKFFYLTLLITMFHVNANFLEHAKSGRC